MSAGRHEDRRRTSPIPTASTRPGSPPTRACPTPRAPTSTRASSCCSPTRSATCRCCSTASPRRAPRAASERAGDERRSRRHERRVFIAAPRAPSRFLHRRCALGRDSALTAAIVPRRGERIMWQQRIKAWLDSIRARFARRGERTTSGDVDAYESRYETDRRRRARRLRPAPIGAADHDRARSPSCRRSRSSRIRRCRASAAARSACASTTSPAASASGARAASSSCPACSEMRVFSLRDQSWRAAQMSRADGPAPLQSVEGLSLGVDLTVRYALDPLKRRARSPRACPTTSAARSSSRRCRA